jgi:hypothetical protein
LLRVKEDAIKYILKFAPGPPGGAVQLVLATWMDRFTDIHGAFNIRVATSALVALLESRHAAIYSCQVLRSCL